MAKFVSSRYPQLRIGGVVRFVDGTCETDDEAAIAQLRKFAARGKYGIHEEAGTMRAPEKEPGHTTPRRTASKADWVAHAVQLGAAPGEAEAMTKEQLVTWCGDHSS